MIAETIAVISLLLVIFLFFVKVYNLFKMYSVEKKTIGKPKEGFYPNGWILLTMAIVILCWFFYYASLIAMISTEVTITNGGTPYTVKANDYVSLANYGNVLNILVFMNFVITIAEILSLFPGLIYYYTPRQNNRR